MSTAYKWCTKCSEQVVMNDVFECPVCLSSSFTHKKELLEVQVDVSPKIASAQTSSPTPKSKAAQSVEKPVSSVLSGELADLIQLQKESIRASNRTTHAVRAFVLFIFFNWRQVPPPQLSMELVSELPHRVISVNITTYVKSMAFSYL